MLIEEIAYHRNGGNGEGFHVVKFIDTTETPHTSMLAIVFPLEDTLTRNGRVAVFSRTKLTQDEIRFGFNSFRGDNYETELRDAIAAHSA